MPSITHVYSVRVLVAAREGEVTAMEAMLSKKGKRKVGVNLKDQEGNTALHIAAEAGMLNVIKLILSRGGIINATNSVGFTALNLACRGGHEKCIRFLVESGAELEVPDTAYGYVMCSAPRHMAGNKSSRVCRLCPFAATRHFCGQLGTATWPQLASFATRVRVWMREIGRDLPP